MTFATMQDSCNKEGYEELQEYAAVLNRFKSSGTKEKILNSV